jgi:hypothetical protein
VRPRGVDGGLHGGGLEDEDDDFGVLVPKPCISVCDAWCARMAKLVGMYVVVVGAGARAAPRGHHHRGPPDPQRLPHDARSHGRGEGAEEHQRVAIGDGEDEGVRSCHAALPLGSSPLPPGRRMHCLVVGEGDLEDNSLLYC